MSAADNGLQEVQRVQVGLPNDSHELWDLAPMGIEQLVTPNHLHSSGRAIDTMHVEVRELLQERKHSVAHSTPNLDHRISLL